MRWLITGAHGMLGRDFSAVLTDRHDVRALGRSELDITDAAAVEKAARDCDVVVNCAAWTDVDGAESSEAAAALVNAAGAGNVARACLTSGSRLVHLSTDYVFAGDADKPYFEDATPNPKSSYGRSKAAGENLVRSLLPGEHYLVRTAWLYGAHGRCFPKTIARLARERGSVTVVADQVGQPTWTADVADLVVRLVESGAPPGTYHATSTGQATWFEFAQEIVASVGLNPGTVTPTTTDRFPRPAPRPLYSVLAHDALVSAGVEPIGHWRQRWRAAAADVLAA